MAGDDDQGNKGQKMDDGVRTWVMVALTFIFVALYTASLIGWLKPLGDDKMVARLEPIIFVIIGYYFGRLPARQNEKSLKEEVKRQSDKSDKAQEQKEQTQKDAESLREKVKSARTALATVAPSASKSELALTLSNKEEQIDTDLLRASCATAVNILDT